MIEELARDRLGYARLRPGQLPAIEALAGGRDVLAVLPAGGGKSAIYELAGLLRTGPTVVISPLIALQDGQLAHLRAAGLPAIVRDNDLEPGEATPPGEPFAVGTRVAGGHWGEGTVQRYDRDHVTVLFDEHGYRDLFVPVDNPDAVAGQIARFVPAPVR